MSPLALSIVVIGLVLAIIGAGVLLILRDDSDDGDDGGAVIPSPSGTSELVQLTETATPTGEPTPSPTETEPTPSPTDEPDPTATEAEEGAPTPTEEVIEPTATSTKPVEPDPTATDVPAASATAEPLEGDFGFLPPAQLPSGGVAARLTLTYQLGMSLESLPASGSVYQISWPTYSLAEVELARDQLGLEGEVVEEGVGVYRVEGEGGSLFVSPSEIIFDAASEGGEGELPGDTEAIGIAANWLALSGFVGSNSDGGAIAGRDDDLQRVIVIFRPASPQPNLAPDPAATVTVGPGGVVLEARIAWPSDLVASDYGYGDPIAVWQAVQSGKGFLEADISAIFETGQLTGNATMTSFSTAYTLAGNPAEGQFLVPVIVFEGAARIDQTGDEIPVYVSIPVVYHEAGTAG